MQINVENTNWGYGRDLVTLSADVVIYDDADPQNLVELWRESISVRRNIRSAGWYDTGKDELLQKAQTIRDQYIANMETIATATGQSSVDDIVADVVAYIEGGLS